MSPYEVSLLVYINHNFDLQGNISFEKTTHLSGSLARLAMRGLIEVQTTDTFIPDNLGKWKTTKLGRAVCERFYAVDESGIKFCGECGQILDE